MKRTETKMTPQPPREETTVVEYRCDLCGADMIQHHGSLEKEEATISLEKSYHAPDCGSSEKKIIDICVKCMLTKVFPWLFQQGATPREEENYW